MDQGLERVAFESPDGGLAGIGGRPDTGVPIARRRGAATAREPGGLSIWLIWNSDPVALRRMLEPIGRANAFGVISIERSANEPEEWRVLFHNMGRTRDAETRALALLHRLQPVARWRRVEQVDLDALRRERDAFDDADDAHDPELSWDALGKRWLP